MNIRKNIILGMITGLVGMALISGGTVAYFNTSIEAKSEIMSGTLKLGIKDEKQNSLNVNDSMLFKFENKKPGDTFSHTFHITNAGSLNMENITFYSEHEIEGDKEFAEQIQITELKVGDTDILSQLDDKTITLEKLASITGDQNNRITLKDYLKVNEEVKVTVHFKFIDSKENQNKYQGNTMTLYWTFEATQTDK